MSAPSTMRTRADVRIEPAELHRRDLRKCVLCAKGLMHTGVPLFWRFTVERFGVDATTVRQEHGMEIFFGNVALAETFSIGKPLAKRFDGPHSVYVCEECAMKSIGCLAAFAEQAADADPEDEETPEQLTGGQP